MQTAHNRFDKFLPYIIGSITAIALLPWLGVYLQQSLNSNMTFLVTGAMRLLDGEAMSKAYYDPNPPLSILIHLPPAMLTKYLGLALYHSTAIYTLTLIGLSTIAVSGILKRTDWLAPARRYAFIATYVLINTIGAMTDIGERDHYLGLALVPFVFVQAAITLKIPLPKLLFWGVLIAGSVFILLKPHFGLVPVCVFAHRAYVQKRLSVCFDPDFMTLAGTTLAYICVIFLFFSDYAFVIFPDVLTFYVSAIEPWVLPVGILLGLYVFIFAAAVRFLFENPPQLALALFACSFLCLIPFVVQGKGFFYHGLPAFIFFLCGLGLVLQHGLKKIFTFLNLKESADNLAACGSILLFIAGLYAFLPPSSDFPTHDDYKNSELAGIIKECDKPCSFFMFNDSIEVVHPLAVYTNATHGSRFPGYWFLLELTEGIYDLEHSRTPLINPEKIETKTQLYADMVAQDFKKYQPDILLIGQFQVVLRDPEPFDFGAFFSRHSPDFKRYWQAYTLVDTIEINIGKDYLTGTLESENSQPVTFNIYKKTGELE